MLVMNKGNCHNYPKYLNNLALYYTYCIYPKYSDTSSLYHTCFKTWTSTIYYLMCLKIVGWVADNVDPDETLLFAQACLSEYIR